MWLHCNLGFLSDRPSLHSIHKAYVMEWNDSLDMIENRQPVKNTPTISLLWDCRITELSLRAPNTVFRYVKNMYVNLHSLKWSAGGNPSCFITVSQSQLGNEHLVSQSFPIFSCLFKTPRWKKKKK